MKAMSSNVSIGDFTFKHINAVEINTSWKTLTDTAIIKVPNLKRILDVNDKKIEVGMRVSIKLGYDGDVYPEFTGYVSSVSGTSPCVINCEDEMWQLKQKSVNDGKGKSWEKITLKQLLNYLVPDAVVETYDVDLSPFRIEQGVSVAKALEKLKDEFGLVIYYRTTYNADFEPTTKLYAGLAYYEKMDTRIKYHFQKNVAKDGLDLTFKNKTDIKIKVRGISVLPDNKRIVKEVGDADGEIHTLHTYNKTEKELEAICTEKIEAMKYDGYRGSFKALGIPRPVHSQTIDLEDNNYPERAGAFFIDSIQKTYDGSSGYKNKIELGKKASPPAFATS